MSSEDFPVIQYHPELRVRPFPDGWIVRDSSGLLLDATRQMRRTQLLVCPRTIECCFQRYRVLQFLNAACLSVFVLLDLCWPVNSRFRLEGNR